MPWDGTGNFVRSNGDHTGIDVWQQDKADGELITATRHDSHDQDLADGINACVAKNGENAAGVVKETWIANNAVTTAKLDDDAVTSAKLADDAVTTAKLADLNVTTGKLAASAVTTAKIANSNVTTQKIADGNVTLAKIANIATDRLIGRDAAGSGVPEELTVGGGIEFSGSGGIRRSALTGDVTASAGSNSTTIANNAVTTAKITDNAVSGAKIRLANGVPLRGRNTGNTDDVPLIAVDSNDNVIVSAPSGKVVVLRVGTTDALVVGLTTGLDHAFRVSTQRMTTIGSETPNLFWGVNINGTDYYIRLWK